MGFDRNTDAIAAGAVRDLSGFQSVLDAALDDIAAVDAAHEQEGVEQWRAIEDGEHNYGFEEHYRSMHEDDGYASGVLVDAYIDAVRAEGRWQDIAAHPRIDELAGCWARRAIHTPGPVEELRALLRATRRSDHEFAGWDAARRNWNPALDAILKARLLDRPDDQQLRLALAECGMTVARGAFIEAMEVLADAATDYLHLLVDAHAVRRMPPSEQGMFELDAVLYQARPEAAEIVRALTEGDRPAGSVSPAALSLLDEVAENASHWLLGRIVPIMRASGAAARCAIDRWLDTTEQDLAEAAAEAAVTTGDPALVKKALNHKRASARLVAFNYLAAEQQTPLTPALLAFAGDPASRLRRALIGALATRPHDAHLPVLVGLTGDEWSDAEPYHYEPESFSIAREALAALAAYGTLADEVGETLLERARKTEDRRLRLDALLAAASQCGPMIRERIWAIAWDKSGTWIRVDALEALSAAPKMEDALVSRITAARLVKMAAPIAAAATLLAATHLPVATLVPTLEEIGLGNSHCSLLVLGIAVLGARDRDAANRLTDLLGPVHPAKRILEDGVKLPADSLDDLGDIRIRRYVRPYLADRIAKQ